MNAEMRLPYSFEVEPYIHRAGRGVGVIANFPNTSLTSQYGPSFTTAASSTAVEGKFYAICDNYPHDTATASTSIAIFRLEADTTQPTLNQIELRRVTRPWADILRKYQQTKKNASAIALIESWLKETDTVDDDETRDLKEMKASLDAHRSSYRQLFP